MFAAHGLDNPGCGEMNMDDTDNNRPVTVIHGYSRQQAIADGVLVDVSKTAREAGLVCPTALTHAVYDRYVEVPPDLAGWQDLAGRLWDVLWMCRCRIVASKIENRNQMLFDLYVQQDKSGPKRVTLKVVCGPGDTPEPVLTIMLPDED